MNMLKSYHHIDLGVSLFYYGSRDLLMCMGCVGKDCLRNSPDFVGVASNDQLWSLR